MPTNSDFSVPDLSKFIAREAYNERKVVDRIVEGNPEAYIASGDVMGPLRLASREGRSLVLRADKSYFCRFRSGDVVDLAQIDTQTNKFKKLKTCSIKCVRFPEPGVIEVLISAKELILNDNSEVFILPKSAEGIKWNIRQRLEANYFSGIRAEHFPVDLSLVRKNFSEAAERLNSTQKEALKFLVDNDFNGLVQGPPGTGKTKLLVDLVKLATKSNVRVGLASLTHTAVDNALARIIKLGVNPELVTRVASNKQKIKAEPYGCLGVDEIWSSKFKNFNVATEFDQEDPSQLYAATLHSWCLSNHPPEIDVLIIDEASQVPIYFYPFLEALCSRVIMFGDHKQLPPVIQSLRHSLPAEDIFTYEIERGSYPMLETQYRMNEGVQEWSSNRFYEGRLQPDESNRYRDMLSGFDVSNKLIGSRVVNLLKHNGHSNNNANRLEASHVAELVWAFKNSGDLSLKDVGIVTPHRTQAGAISASLQEKLGLAESQNVLIDTVERFQGQEKEAMILSMGVEQDCSRKGDKGFLGDGRRLNVAVTRAKSRFYCLAPDKLLENTKKQKNAGHLNSFFKWCSYDNKSNENKDIA